MFSKKILINSLKGAVLCAGMVAGTAMAASWSDVVNVQGLTNGSGDKTRYGNRKKSKKAQPQIYQAINRLTGSNYSTNLGLAGLYVDDTSWTNLNGLVVIGQSAGNHNTLGTYDLTTGSVTDIIPEYHGFDWFIPSPLDSTPAALMYHDVQVGGEFGWHLQSKKGWFSDKGRNKKNRDHMLAFDLGGPLTFGDYLFDSPYLIAWEDLDLGDKDYNDIMYVVNATSTVVPLPPSVLLFLSGMVGLMGFSRFRGVRRQA